MTLCSRGHEDAFTELYDLTSQRIYGIILRVLRSPDHAAEVTQEVYVEVWRQSARYSPGKGSVIAWMTTMAHRRAVDRVRSVSSEWPGTSDMPSIAAIGRSTRYGMGWSNDSILRGCGREWPR
jgi:DNA-directed RNA polymerase specialized sigma24 family protein